MILCVDRADSEREQTRRLLSEAGYETAGAESVDGGRRRLRGADDLTCLVTEYDLPDGTGLELTETLRETHPDALAVVFTDVPVDEMDTDSFGGLVAEYVSKADPDAGAELLERVERGLAHGGQTDYPLPDDEDARIAALERYAADPAVLGASLDRVTELATELFDVDAASVGLVDAHEQRFLSCRGVSFDPLAREKTVCTYAVLDDDVTVVEDVSADPRFEGNEGLEAAGIRFYASAPLVTPEGHVVGTLCVYDGEPREFSERERDLLDLLGEDAMEHLEHRRRANANADGGTNTGTGGENDE